MSAKLDSDTELACGLWSRFRSSDEVDEWSSANPETAGMCAWAYQWAHEGLWTLTCGHKFGAALACTNTSGMADDLELPARAFRVQFPNGLLVADGEEIAKAYVHVVDQGDCHMFLTVARGADRFSMTLRAPSARALLFAGPDDVESRLDQGQERLVVLTRRVVVGLLYAMQHTDNFRTKSYSISEKRRDKRGPPDHRIVFVGRPLSIDARPQVEAWLSGSKRSAPTLQHIVRGHYKRQVVGVSGAGRKVIWVEPYWRGPEDAPILVRPRSVG